ncbi:MAG: hypothetical protein ABSE69_13400 [Roseiarcus sp.]
MKEWVTAALPRSTCQVGAWIGTQSASPAKAARDTALLHRLGLDYHKPAVIPRKLNEDKQEAFVASYEKLMNSLDGAQIDHERAQVRYEG